MNNTTGVKTILILAANPANTSRLRLDAEVREIEEGLQRASEGGRFKLVQKWAVRSRDFYRAILEHRPQIVHFSGHGTGIDGIVLEDETGQATLVEKEELSKLFKLFAVKGVECVVLNACYSEVQAEAISQYIKHVIGMTQAIGDKAAISFAVAFYDALGAGETVEFAFDLGCSQLIRLKEEDTPVLKTRLIHPADIQFEVDDIPPNPYQGLSAFEEKDAAFFFGRKEYTNQLFEMVHQQLLVPIIGASGSGKSSVVFAGLIPLLREEGTWVIEPFRPKSQPFDELALALVRQLEPNLNGVEKVIKVGKLSESLKKQEVKLHQVASQILENKSNKRFLLVVDQFEELYTQCQDKEEQQCFINTLLTAVHQKSIILIFTLRADFYGYALSYLPLCEALQQFRHTPLGLMRREELQAAIEQPAQKLNVKFQTHLVVRILDDIGNEPGNLPLLEFALTELWNKQKDNELTHKAYDEIGGVKQALVKHADRIYFRLSASQQQQAQQIFLTLVRLGETTEDTRRVASYKDIGRQNWELVTYLASSEARLLVTGRNDKSGEETVEVAHEALIQKWEYLRQWLEKDRDFRIWLQELRSARQQWEKSNRDNDVLLRGKALVDAQEWLQKRPDDLTLEQEYIQSSLRLQYKEQQKQEQNRRFILAGIIGGTCILAGALGFGWWQTEIQRKEAQKNEIKALTSSSENLLIANQSFDALIYALKAGKKLKQAVWKNSDLKQQVIKVLQEAVESLKELNRLEGHTNWVYDVNFSPDGNNIVSASLDKTVKIWKRDGTLLNTLQHEGKVYDVSFCNTDGSFATASEDKTVKIWKRDGTLDKNLPHKFGVLKASFAPDCKILVTASDKQVLLWNVEQKNPKILHTIETNSTVNSVSFSPDGKIITTASDDNIIRLLKLDGTEIQKLKGHKDKIYDISFSSNGQRIATASWDKTAKIWSLVNGKWFFSRTLTGHTDRVYGVSFSPDGNTIATASWDKTVKLWNLDGTLRLTIKHEDRVNSVSFSKDNTIASGGADNTVKLWKIDHNLLPIQAHNKAVRSVSFNPKLDMIATASEDGNVKLWHRDGRLFKTLDLSYKADGNKPYVNGVSFSPDGKMLAIASADQTTQLWNIEGKKIKTLKGHAGEVFSASYSPDGKMIVTASADKTAKLWKSDGENIGTLGDEQGN